MKKVLVTIVAIAMLISMFAVVSHAEYMGKCFDGAFLTNNAEVNTHVPTSDEKDMKSEATAGDFGNIYNLGYSYIHFQGWFTDDDEFTDLGYQINDGEIVWGIGNYDSNIIGLTGGTYALRFNFNLAIVEGMVKINFYEKLANGDAKKCHTISYANAAPDPNVKQFANVNVGNGSAIGVWLQGDNNFVTLKFTTAGEFKGFGEGIYWASNETVPNGAYAKMKVELFKFAYNTEYTLQQKAVKTFTVDSLGDNNPVAFFNFDDALPAGTYIVRYTLTNPEATITVDGAEKGSYLVLPKMDANPDESKFTYSRPDQAFNFTVLAENMTEFFVANPEETDAPSEQPAVVSAIDGVINDGEYTESHAINADNFKAWTASPNMDGKEFKYFFNMKSDGLYVGVKAKGANANDLIQLNFNPGDKLSAVPGLFISFKLGDALTVLQHNHKTGVLDNDSAGGADITDKIENKIVKTDDGYDFEVKLPVEFFTVTDVDGADAFTFGADPLYYGMFAVVGGQGYTNQTNAPGSDWSCNGLGLTEYCLVINQPKTGDATVAMFAVMAILAMGAAVVFAKKRSF